MAVADQLRSEYVIEVTGVVKQRKPKDVNPKMKTGEIEVEVHEAKILNKAKTPPFDIEDGVNASDELKMKYRYLDLRRPEMLKGLKIRNRITQAVHSYLDEQGFLDIETPDLTKSTPEGARDYLVPSRVYPWTLLCFATITTTFQTIVDGSGN